MTYIPEKHDCIDYDCARACMRCRLVFGSTTCPGCGAWYDDKKYRVYVMGYLHEKKHPNLWERFMKKVGYWQKLS